MSLTLHAQNASLERYKRRKRKLFVSLFLPHPSRNTYKPRNKFCFDSTINISAQDQSSSKLY